MSPSLIECKRLCGRWQPSKAAWKAWEACAVCRGWGVSRELQQRNSKKPLEQIILLLIPMYLAFQYSFFHAGDGGSCLQFLSRSKAIFSCVIIGNDTKNCQEIEGCEVRQPAGDSHLIWAENVFVYKRRVFWRVSVQYLLGRAQHKSIHKHCKYNV